MEGSKQAGPVIACVENEQGLPLIVQCALGLALQFHVGLHLAVVLVLPLERELALTESDELAAEALLDAAAALASESNVGINKGIWVARRWNQAIDRMVLELSATALVIRWRARGPLNMLDIGRTVLKAIPCPVFMVGQPASEETAGWPPRWLLNAQLRISD